MEISDWKCLFLQSEVIVAMASEWEIGWAWGDVGICKLDAPCGLQFAQGLGGLGAVALCLACGGDAM